jgi:hypothetical protein
MYTPGMVFKNGTFAIVIHLQLSEAIITSGDNN